MARALTTTTEAGVALRGQTPSPSPRSASISLQAAAAVNAGLQHEDSRRKCRAEHFCFSRLTMHRLLKRVHRSKSALTTCGKEEIGGPYESTT
jgi:hypothetical protein